MQYSNFVNSQRWHTVTTTLYWLSFICALVIAWYVIGLALFGSTQNLGDPYYEYDVLIWNRAPIAWIGTWILWLISGILWVISLINKR